MRSLLVAVCLVATAAAAQKSQPEQKPVAVQKIEFEPDLVEGGLTGPLGEIYQVPPRVKFGSLIRIRMNFNDKLRESVHEM